MWVRLTLKYAKVVTSLTKRLTWAEFDYDTGCASSFSPILRTGTTTKKTKYWESYLHSAQREVSWVHCSSSIDIALKLLWTLLPLSNSKRKRKYVCSNETICRFPFQYDYIIIWASEAKHWAGRKCSSHVGVGGVVWRVILSSTVSWIVPHHLAAMLCTSMIWRSSRVGDWKSEAERWGWAGKKCNGRVGGVV